MTVDEKTSIKDGFYSYPIVSKDVSNTIAGARNSIRQKKYSLRLRQLGVERHEYGGLEDSGKFPYDQTVQGSKFEKSRWRFLLDADFKISDQCCQIMKKNPAKHYETMTGRHPLIATMACETMQRANAWVKLGCNAFEGRRPRSTPMSFWTEQDVLAYLKQFEVPYARVYGDIIQNEKGEYTLTGVQRTGCMFCMFGVHKESEPNRFQQMKVTHPKQYEYCINSLGCGRVLDYINVPYD